MLEDRKRLEEIEALRDEDIDYSDIPVTDAAFWADAELRIPEGKKRTKSRLPYAVKKTRGKSRRAIRDGSLRP